VNFHPEVFSSELEIKVFASFDLVTMKEVQTTATTRAWNICDLKYTSSRTQRFQTRAQMELFKNLKVIMNGEPTLLVHCLY